jgi:hypothetical protein
MANEYRSKSGAEREDERSDRERKRDKRKDIYGTNIPNAEERKAYEREERRRQVIENGIAQGIPEEEIADYADRALGLSGSATPRLDRQAYEQEQIDKRRQAEYERTGFRSEGDRATYRTQKALRKLMNKPSAAVQFAANIDKSVALGGESALNTEAGLVRAYEQGTRAGYNREQIDQMIGRARQKSGRDQTTQRAYNAANQLAASSPADASRSAPAGETTQERVNAEQAAAAAATKPATGSVAEKAVQEYTGEPVTVEAVKPTSLASVIIGGSGVDRLQGAGSLSVIGRGVGKVLEGVVDASKNLPVSEITAKTKAAKTAARLGGGRTPIAGTPYARAVETAKRGERLLKVARPLESAAGVAGKAAPYVKGVSKAVGKVAVPLDLAMSAADVVRFASDENRRQEVLSEFEKRENQGALRRALGGALDPANTLLATGSNIRTAFGARQRALESEAAAETAKRRNEQVQRLLRESRPDYAEMSSEDVRALSREDRAARAKYLASLRRRVTAQ